MLLTGNTRPLAPPGDFVAEDLYTRRRWRRVQYLADQFWTRWRREYLQNLQRRLKWQERRTNLAAGADQEHGRPAQRLAPRQKCQCYRERRWRNEKSGDRDVKWRGKEDTASTHQPTRFSDVYQGGWSMTHRQSTMHDYHLIVMNCAFGSHSVTAIL